MLYKNGETVKNIAVKFGIKPEKLYYYVYYHRELFPKRRTYRRISKTESDVIFNEYMNECDLSIKELAKRHNITTNTVRSHLGKHFEGTSK